MSNDRARTTAGDAPSQVPAEGSGPRPIISVYNPAGVLTKTIATLPDGSRLIDDYGPNGTTVADQRFYNAAGMLEKFKLFGASGETLRATTINVDGSTTTSVYAKAC